MRRRVTAGNADEGDILDELEDVERESSELKAWKESMLSVLPPLQEIARELGLPLGQSIHDRILPAIQRLKAEIDHLKLLFKKHADHTTNCPVHFDGAGDCACGFSGCLSRLNPQLTEPKKRCLDPYKGDFGQDLPPYHKS